jgi:hypothetical protein
MEPADTASLVRWSATSFRSWRETGFLAWEWVFPGVKWALRVDVWITGARFLVGGSFWLGVT